MDLFEDIPGPPGVNKSVDAVSSLYGDIPTQPVTKATEPPLDTSLSLYDDMPEQSIQAPQNTSISLYDEIPKQLVPETTQPGNSKRKLNEEHPKHSLEKRQKTVMYEIDSYIVERQGERVDMQDAHVIIRDFTSQIPNLHPSIYRISVYGVFDGHGGVRASRFASENLHKNLRDKFPKGDITVVERDIRKTFIDAFKKTDDDFLRMATKSKPVWKDGTTVILVLLINETMYIANIGDSQAVLCRYKEDTKCCVPVSLSVQHNPSLYDERMRIQKKGGHVKDGRVMGVLEVSRSIGDGQYKKLGVTCTPDVKKCALTNNDRYVIIACDGLWKCFEPEDSIKFANKILEDELTSEMEETSTAKNSKYEAACNRLANEAVLRFSGDNVTVLLLAIRTCR